MKIQFYHQKNQGNLPTELQNQIISSDKELMDFPWAAEHWQKIFKHFENYCLVLMLDADKLVGFILGSADPDNFHLLKIVVEKNYRRQGLAQKLFDFLIQWQQKEGKKNINLEVRNSNASAIHFYQKNQFLTLHTQAKFYSSGETALIMQRKLDK
ncbi:MAG: ribosomal protein S18-alanine N-acetyltransferase [Bacteriovoracaceae bacterium]|nr:ribosomal protein S18-alanine N-acetyltransferase [Bacteriovoracaceae bacterium]